MATLGRGLHGPRRGKLLTSRSPRKISSSRTNVSQWRSSDRLSLCKELVRCGAETPATAFGRDKDGVTDATKVAPIFMGMSVDALTDHVTAKKAAFKAGGGNRRAPEHRTLPALAEEIPVNVEGKVVMLNAHDQKFCKDNNVSHIARARVSSTCSAEGQIKRTIHNTENKTMNQKLETNPPSDTFHNRS